MVPSRTVIRQWLSDLARGEISREQAADFARPWIGDREREVADAALWTPLTRLAGADLNTAPSEFLYDVWDFEVWLKDFELATDLDEPRK